METGGPIGMTPADVGVASASLARAFADDPVRTFLFPKQSSRLRRLERFFGTVIEVQHLPHGLSFTNPERTGAAVWDPPGSWRTSVGQILRGLPGLFGSIGTRIPVALRALATVEKTHPKEPHYYLAYLGTRPEAQGHGVGSTLMEPVLARADEEGLGAYLESSNAANIPFYRRHGFEVTGEITLPGGPSVWPMWREARPPGG
ncbi:MAG: GNAT family N-acetyltransferase [Acidimicrobiales bacterium]